MNLVEQIEYGLTSLNCPALSQELQICEQIAQYLLLIEKWNKRFNLTAIRTVEDMLYQHIMDSLAVIGHLHGPIIADVGTGAGLPGIPLAIARPDWQVIMIESNQKKAAFLQQVKIELELANIEVVAKRIEDTEINNQINTIISRAFASLSTFIKLTQHLIPPDNGASRWVAMKSKCAEQELKEVSEPFYIEKVVPLIVPGLFAKRELIIIRRSTKPIGSGQE